MKPSAASSVVRGPSVSSIVVSLVLAISLNSSTSSRFLQDFHYATQDSVVIKPVPEYELQLLGTQVREVIRNDNNKTGGGLTRRKRQFQGFPFQFPQGGGGGIAGFPQFPPGWPFIQPGQFPGFPGVPTQPAAQPPVTQPPPPMTTTTMSPIVGGDSCRTRNGMIGRCTTFRQCYPVVYSSVEGEEEQFRNPVLAALLREASGPCETLQGPQFLFRADAQLRQSMICCGDSSSGVAPTSPPSAYPPPDEQYPVTHPHNTQRPPWAQPSTMPTTTTTTTPQPPPPTQPHWPQIQQTTSTTPSPPPAVYPGSGWPPPIPTHPPNHTPATHPWDQKVTQQQYPTSPQWTQQTSTTQRIWWQPPPQQTYPTQRPQYPTTSAPVSIPSTPVYPQPPPSASSCGFTKIVGGVQATKGEFPWLVAIMKNGKQFCGGSLIDSQWILSAAHCFQPIATPGNIAQVQVQIGDYDIYSNADGPVTIRRVSKLIMHSGFSHQTLHNDIALLKLDSPVQMGSNGNNNIQPICLGGSSGLEGQAATVAGWGGLYNNGPQPSTYRKVDMPIWSNNQCAVKYGGYAPGGITSHMICAGSTTKDACRGDSGGPLMKNNGGRWEQIGIVSWGIGCGQYPGVYTRVDHYSDWIARNRVS